MFSILRNVIVAAFLLTIAAVVIRDLPDTFDVPSIGNSGVQAETSEDGSDESDTEYQSGGGYGELEIPSSRHGQFLLEAEVNGELVDFLVDTGAASVASTALISTWIGYEVGLIDQGLQIIGSSEDAYTMFMRTIPYRFYPLLALVFAFMVSSTDRDFGPMLRAERRARREGKVIRDGAEPVENGRRPRGVRRLRPCAMEEAAERRQRLGQFQFATGEGAAQDLQFRQWQCAGRDRRIDTGLGCRVSWSVSRSVGFGIRIGVPGLGFRCLLDGRRFPESFRFFGV